MMDVIADITITEKSFGPKVLMTGVRFSVEDGEKVGVVGRNGIGKSTLLSILTGVDTDYTGEVVFKRGTSVVATAQEHHGSSDQTVMEYILQGLPEYASLHHIIKTHPDHMGDNLKKIDEYTAALERFGNKGFYQVEELVAEELKNFQMEGFGERLLNTLSGGQKRLVEVVKIMHADADLALLDEPTNHMDYVAKKQFIDWLRQSQQAMLIITHDRDVLREVDRIIELKDGGCQTYKGSYDAYLKQNAISTGTAMNDFEMVEKRMVNLKQKVLDYQRLKEKSRNPSTIQKFKRLETQSREELVALQAVEKPTFWIDKESAENLNYKVAAQYQKFKAKNIRLSVENAESRSKHVLVRATDLALGYGDNLLFEGVNIDLREGEVAELRGRNGAGKTTVIRALLQTSPLVLTRTSPLASSPASTKVSSARSGAALRAELRLLPPSRMSSPSGADGDSDLGEAVSAFSLERDGKMASNLTLKRVMRGGAAPVLSSAGGDVKEGAGRAAGPADSGLRSEAKGRVYDGSEEGGDIAASELICYSGSITLDPHVRVGIYEQEISETYLQLPLAEAIERMYMDKKLPISTTKIRQLMADYLFTEADGQIPLARLSGGQKARFQLISMLANEPQLLILDEPTNHLDLPSIEELETALAKYSGAILYVSHDDYFRHKLGGQVVTVGA